MWLDLGRIVRIHFMAKVLCDLPVKLLYERRERFFILKRELAC